LPHPLLALPPAARAMFENSQHQEQEDSQHHQEDSQHHPEDYQETRFDSQVYDMGESQHGMGDDEDVGDGFGSGMQVWCCVTQHNQLHLMFK
jgi:hypothetical protein